MNKVCILTTVHPVFDTRIFHKEAKTLTRAGYDVTLIAQHERDEVVDGVKIIAMPKAKNRFFRIFGLTYKAFRLALRKRADIYHFHDPELIFVGLILKIFGKKVIYDVHEDVPKQILNKEWIGNLFIRKFTAAVFNIFEQFGASRFDGIVAATDDIANKFNPKKTISLRNFPILGLIDKSDPVNIDKNKFVIIYAGGLTRIRGIKEVIQAMEYLNGQAELWLLGEWESEGFEKECRSLEGFQYTKYLGFKEIEEVYGYMKKSDLGIATLYPVKNYLNSLPVKAFEYMACGLPIVMSNFPYWQELFKDCALFADPKDPKDIAERINVLLEDINLRIRLGKAGRDLVEKKYSWEAESTKLLDLYKDLSK